MLKTLGMAILLVCGVGCPWCPWFEGGHEGRGEDRHEERHEQRHGDRERHDEGSAAGVRENLEPVDFR